MTFFISDLHLFHDRQFIYVPRGFKTVYEMNDAIVINWNKVVSSKDDVYILGDLMLNDTDRGIRLLKCLSGKIHIIRGNHDTDNRIEAYKECDNVVEICDAKYIRYNGYHFFLTHYPCLTGSLEKDNLKAMTCNLFGHTHSKDMFYEDMPYMYNVACDAHNCTPVSIDEIINDMNDKVAECLKML